MLIFVSLIQLIVPLDVVSMECPQNYSEWRQKEIIFSCPSGTYYHCLLDEKGLTTEMCFEKSWIQPGFCPEFNSMSKKMDVSLCTESRGKCPLRTYWSNDVFMYNACLPRNYIRNGSYAVIETMPKATASTSASTEINTNGDIGNETSETVIIVPLIVGLILLCVVTAVLIYVWHRRRGLTSDREENPAESGTTSPLMTTPTKTDGAESGTTSPLMTTPTKTDDAESGTTSPLMTTPTKTDDVQASDGKKLSKDDKDEYSAKLADKAAPLLKENGILLLVCSSTELMAEIGQSLALKCDTQEFPSGFKEYLDSFIEMEKSNQKTKCVVFNDCFKKDKYTIKVLEYKSVFNELYEKQVASEGRLWFVIAIPMSVWNTRYHILSKWNLFNEKHIFKINNPPFLSN